MVYYVELLGKEHYEAFIDLKSKGNIHAIVHAKDHGMTTHMKDSLRLMKEHSLKGLSMMEFPSLPKLPDWFRNLLPKK